MILVALLACGEDEEAAELVDSWLAAEAPEMTRTSAVSVTAEFRCWRHEDAAGAGVRVATLDGDAIAKVVHFDGEVGSGEYLESVRSYQAAWVDVDERDKHLMRGWSPGGRFVDPSADVKGRERLEDHIDQTLSNPLVAGVEFVEVGGMDQEGDAFRFHWQMVGKGKGKVWIEGYDYGELDETGRVKLLVGCWEPRGS